MSKKDEAPVGAASGASVSADSDAPFGADAGAPFGADAGAPFGADAGAPFGVNDWRHLLRSLGEDPMRQGLVETPDRAARAWQHWTRGYKEDPNAILKTFEDGSENYNQLIVVKRIPVYSHCEHHLAPFFGHAAIGYLPTGRIVGLSKLTRLVNCFAARLQVQERLTQQIAQSLLEHLQPKAVGVIIRCRHMCMESRGIAVAGEETVTSAMLGDLEKNQAQRAEFLALVSNHD